MGRQVSTVNGKDVRSSCQEWCLYLVSLISTCQASTLHTLTDRTMDRFEWTHAFGFVTCSAADENPFHDATKWVQTCRAAVHNNTLSHS